MKIVFVTNEFDTKVSVPKRIEFEQRNDYDAELHVVPFEQARLAFPVTTAPCIFILFDQLEGDFPMENLDRIKQAVRQAFSGEEEITQ